MISNWVQFPKGRLNYILNNILGIKVKGQPLKVYLETAPGNYGL